MEFLKHLTANKSTAKLSTQLPCQDFYDRELNQDISSMSKTIKKNGSDDDSAQVFMPFHTLIDIKDYRRTLKRPKTLKEFKQNIEPENFEQKRTRSIVSFIQPDFLVKTLFQDHSHNLKVNQIKYFATSKKGLRNFQTLENQDVIMIQRVANIFKYFGIFDGHGQFGKLIAEICSKYFRNCIKSYEEEFKREISQRQIVEIVQTCIKKTQSYLHSVKFNEIQYSGTTALIVFVTPRSIISFNLGNSRFVIGIKEQMGQKIYDFQVTHDHSLNRLDQRLRVKKKGAIIAPLKDQLGQSYGPDRLWSKNQKKPGTFITRALGLACGYKAGIISDPEVSILSYNKRMKFLVLASDGLWSVEQSDQVIEYLYRYYIQGQLGMGTQSLIQQAVTRWKTKNQLMDDITIIAVSLCQSKLN